MMVWFVSQYCKPSVELLYGKQPHHLVREGHWRQTDTRLTALVYRFTKPIWSANRKDEFLNAAVHLLL